MLTTGQSQVWRCIQLTVIEPVNLGPSLVSSSAIHQYCPCNNIDQCNLNKDTPSETHSG